MQLEGQLRCHKESVNQGGGRDKSWANCSKMVSIGQVVTMRKGPLVCCAVVDGDDLVRKKGTRNLVAILK